MEINNNTIRLVRAIVKLSSSLYDIDEMQENSKYKFQLKKDLNKWHPWVEDYIKDPMNSFGKADPDTLMSLIKLFDDYENKIFIKDDFTTRINLFLAKTESALYDINTLDEPYQTYMSGLRIRILELLSHNYFKPYITYVDKHGMGYKAIVMSMNTVGDTIIVGTL